MTVSFVGVMVARQIAGGPDSSPLPYVRETVLAYERAGFDCLLIGWGSSAGDGIATAGYATSITERLKFVVAQRTGFIAPTVAARQLATLDHFSGGRIALHVISGGNDAEQRRDGDWVDHDGRYRRTGEYLDILKRVWDGGEPFDYVGEFYRVAGSASVIRPLQRPHPPILFGGASDIAVQTGARHADTYVLYAEPLADIARRISAVRDAAKAAGREIGLGLTIRTILGATEREAWERAFAIRERVRASLGDAASKPANPEGVGYMRSFELAQQNEVYDGRLWTGITLLTAGAGESTALVGTPAQVAESLLRYVDLGVRLFFIQGWDPATDPEEQGRDLLPLVRAGANRMAS